MISIELAAFIAVTVLILLLVAVGMAAFFGTRREVHLRGSTSRRELRRVAREAAKRAGLAAKAKRVDAATLAPRDLAGLKQWVEDVPPIPQVRARSTAAHRDEAPANTDAR